MGNLPGIVFFYCILYRCQIEHNGLTNSVMEICTCIYVVLYKYLETAFLEDGMSTN